MHYHDSLYGTNQITEPLLIDVLESQAMQRLQGVLQHGVTALLGITPDFSRFEHSLGTMLLVRRLGASLDEQLAALLHDVSHTAFSHVIDYVFETPTGQSYHEYKKTDLVASSDLPKLLASHGLNWKDYLEESQFPLLEQAAPALCADRLDYFFRDLEFLGLADKQQITAALDELIVVDKSIAVASPECARWLAYTYIEADRASWSNLREVGLYQLTAEAIKSARRTGCIQESDIWGSDAVLWAKLSASEHNEVRQFVDHITTGTRFTQSMAPHHFQVTPKVRSIDPPVALKTGLQPLSALDPAFAKYRQRYHQAKQGPWSMSVITAPGRNYQGSL